MKVDGACQPAFGLDANDVGSDDLSSGCADLLAESEDGRRHGHRVVTSEGARDIVIVEGVRGRAIDQCRIERARSAIGAEHQRFARRFRDARRLQQDLRAIFRHARQRACDGIDDGRAGFLEGLRGEILLVEGANLLCEPSGIGRRILAAADVGCHVGPSACCDRHLARVRVTRSRPFWDRDEVRARQSIWFLINVSCMGCSSASACGWEGRGAPEPEPPSPSRRPPHCDRRFARRWRRRRGRCRPDSCRRTGRPPSRRRYIAPVAAASPCRSPALCR